MCAAGTVYDGIDAVVWTPGDPAEQEVLHMIKLMEKLLENLTDLKALLSKAVCILNPEPFRTCTVLWTKELSGLRP